MGRLCHVPQVCVHPSPCDGQLTVTLLNSPVHQFVCLLIFLLCQMDQCDSCLRESTLKKEVMLCLWVGLNKSSVGEEVCLQKPQTHHQCWGFSLQVFPADLELVPLWSQAKECFQCFPLRPHTLPSTPILSVLRL